MSGLILDLDDYIVKAFINRWSGNEVRSSLDKMKEQLHKNLTDQINGYWSGHTAYGIMIDYGFLIDAKHENRRPKKLTRLGTIFMKHYEEQL